MCCCYINNSQLLGYTECYKHIATSYDQQLLQDDLNCLFDWSKAVDLSFSLSKCIHMCINPTFFAW